MSRPIFDDQNLVAVIEPDLMLRYETSWTSNRNAFPISLSMPLDRAEHPADVVIPWLMNLLPEGEPLRAMTRAMGISQDDILGLIDETGRDLAGALVVGRPRAGEEPAFRPIATEAELERIIDGLPAKPFLVGVEGVSMSLAGAQEKLPLALVDGRLAIPIGGEPSTHILKPDNSKLLGSVQNEALCMVLARRCGLPTARVTTGVAGKRSYLLVTRYDRTERDGRSVRLHQEDFCQALGKPPVAKYQHNSSGVAGPSLPEMFALVREHMTARDINGLLDAVIFNVAVGNVDSHAKNYSIFLTRRLAALAPLYDLMSGLDWPHITQNHAQDIGGQRRGRHIYGRHWRRMAEAAGLAGPATLRRVTTLTERVLAELPGAVDEVMAMPAGGDRLDRFAAAITERVTLVRNHAATDGPAAPDATPALADDGARYDA